MPRSGALSLAVLAAVSTMIAACGGGGATSTPTPVLNAPTETEADRSGGPTSGLPAATPSADERPATGSKVGQSAPDFTLALDTGENVRISALRDQGRPVVLYFFATW